MPLLVCKEMFKEMNERCKAKGGRKKDIGQRREEGKGALRLLNTLASKIRCEIPLLFAGRSGPSDLEERTDVLEAKEKRI